MVSPKELLSNIESSLLAPNTPSPTQRINLIHSIRRSRSSLHSLLIFSPPKASDRAQVQSREVRLPDSGPISLDEQDVQIALKLSDDLHLNEIDCVQLLVSANQEWGFLGREPLDILRLTAGLWYTGRRDLLTALYSLLRAVVLDPGLDDDLVADIQMFLEDLLNSGLRQRLISLIKELNREEAAGLGGPNCEPYIIDSRGALVERRAVVCRERLLIGHCLILSVLVVRASSKDIKDLFSVLKDTTAELDGSNDILKYQITYSILFSLVIAFISDALSGRPDNASFLSSDASFRHEFQENLVVTGNDPTTEGFIGAVRLAWTVHLMTTQEGVDYRDSISGASSDMQNICSSLETIFTNNVFQFLLDKVLQTAAYQNDDEDMVYMYNAYLHKLVTCFLSHPLARDKIKETKDNAMAALSPYRVSGSNEFVRDISMHAQQATEAAPQPFISLLEFVSEIYQKEPELLSGNDVLWTFVNFAGEDHNNFQTLVAFLKFLSTLASSEEGASKVFDLLHGKTFRSIGWSTLFDCISIYEEKFKQSIQSAGAILPEFQEGDAKALVAYLNVLQKVIENGNPVERQNWFPDIEPLFKLLSYENVPPYLKGALRNAISSFIKVSPNIKGAVWNYLEQYDLPVVVGPNVGTNSQPFTTQVYDMRFELNEIETRREQYPSTISFLNLLNALTAEERDVGDRGRRFIGIFRFVYDHVFGPFPQRAYADASEKWQLAVSCLQHFRMILKMYDTTDDDIDSGSDRSSGSQSTPLQTQIPLIELLKDFMSGKTVFRNIMGILLRGVNAIITQRSTQTYGLLLEKAVLLSLEILILVLEKDFIVSDYWRPMYQPLDVILAQDNNQILALLEYVRYDFRPEIQQCSIKIMSILSNRMVGLVPLLLKTNAANSLVEDYAACLEVRSEECQVIENSSDDPGVLIMQLLIENVSRPAPNVTHLLLKFDLDTSIERTILQPKFHYSCLKVILDILEKLSKPDVNSLLHEFGFQLIYILCSDALTCGPMMDLLSKKKYQFFVKHLDVVGVEPLPKRNSSQALRISSLHMRAWLLKLLAIELHAGDVTDTNHRETCQSIVAHMFGQNFTEYSLDHSMSQSVSRKYSEGAGKRTITRSKVLELLEIVQFRSPDTTVKYSQALLNLKYGYLAEDILGSSAASGKGGVYYYSERGDRLIDLVALRDKLWQKCKLDSPHMSSFGSEVEIIEVRDTIQQLLRWAWKYNKNMEEQAAQLHMLTGWSQIVEVSASRRISSLEDQSEILFQLLDASLTASGSQDCSLKMALILSQVALTSMAKLRDERFAFPGGLINDTVTYLDIVTLKQLSNGACHSILFKLVTAMLRTESSEALRRRQYALLLSYFQYCQHMLDPDVPTTVLQGLLVIDEDSEDVDLQKIDKDQAELAHANFMILKKEAQGILDMVTKDATQASDSGKTMALYVLGALVCIDHDKFFLNQLQSRGFLRSCLTAISNSSYQDRGHSVDPKQKLYTLEAVFVLLLRISHRYGNSGAQVLFTMGAMEHISSCKAINLQLKGSLMRVTNKFGRDQSNVVHKEQMVITPLLRLVFCLTSMLNTSEYFEVKNKVVREIIDFVKGHQLLFDQVLREDVSHADEQTMEQMNLVVGILSKVWPYEESDEYGVVQGLFGMMRSLFAHNMELLTLRKSSLSAEDDWKSELNTFRLCFSLNSYLYFLVTRKSIRLQVSDSPANYLAYAEQKQPTLSLISILLNSITGALERAAEEKFLLLSKIQDINELSRQEVDEIINMCSRGESVSSSDNIQKRRYIAMAQMYKIVGYRDQLVKLLLLLSENVLNIILVHFQDGSSTYESSQATKAVTYGTELDTNEDLSDLCTKMMPTLDRLESLSEKKTGHNLKVFRRLVNSVKELTYQKLAS